MTMALDETVDFLSCPQAYAERPRWVEVIETHRSWVFLTTTCAFKLKKATFEDGLDLRTVEARRRNSEEEVRLNRRLAPAVYLGTTPVVRDEETGRLQVGGPGEPVDWLVVMTRLAADRTLERRILDARLDEGEVRRFAGVLADFYASCAPVERTGPEHRRFLVDGACRDWRELLEPRYGLPRSAVEPTLRALVAALERLAEPLEGRRLVEGHGDLRPEHVYLGAEPVVIDCLDFDRALRLLDPIDELAFLALECERLGAPIAGEWVIDEYQARTGDRPHHELPRLYRRYRACRRAVLAIRHLRDPHADARRWRARAERYLALAQERV